LLVQSRPLVRDDSSELTGVSGESKAREKTASLRNASTLFPWQKKVNKNNLNPNFITRNERVVQKIELLIAA
jgi:hypothetical protein